MEVLSWSATRRNFCDRGQGDIIIIVTAQGKQFISDRGPDNKLQDYLNQDLLFFDHFTGGILITHLGVDHLVGFVSLFKPYKADQINRDKLNHRSAEYEQLEREIG